MRNFRTLIAVAMMAVLPTSLAMAQEGEGAAEGSKMRIGGEGVFVLPLGDWADFSGIGIGALFRFDYKLSDKLAITANPGYIFHLSTNDLSTAELLLTGGVRFFVTPEIDVHGMTGLNLWTIKASFGGTSASSTETRIPLIVGGGYNMASGLVIGANLIVPNLLLTDGDDVQMGIMATVGYTIGM